jgi:hypothetical protein
MADDALELPVRIPGAGQAAGDLDRVASAGQRTAQSMDRAEVSVKKTASAMDSLKQKLGSGEVLRNAAASAVLLSQSASGSADKVAALAGALAMVPGPIGAVSAAVAVGATVWSTYGKSAEEAANKAKAAAAASAEAVRTAMANQEQAKKALAAASGGATGDAARLAEVSGVSEADVKKYSVLYGGDTTAGTAAAAALQEAGLSAEARAKLEKQADLIARTGGKVDMPALIKSAQDEQTAIGAAAARRAQGGPLAPLTPIAGQGTAAATIAEALGISESAAQVRIDRATSAGGQAQENLRRGAIGEAFNAPSQALDNFRSALNDATQALREAEAAQRRAPPAERSGTGRALFGNSLDRYDANMRFSATGSY